MGKMKYNPQAYVFENFEFKNMFKGYRLLKVGYSGNPKERLRQMPKWDKCKIIHTKEGGWDTEQAIMASFSDVVVIHPFYGYFNRVKVKSKPYHSFEWEDTDMFNYLNNLREGMGRTGWGYTEWFVAKDN
jgi:hypothetical protein